MKDAIFRGIGMEEDTPFDTPVPRPIANAHKLETARIMETVADISYQAGVQGYYSGDSRTDISRFIDLAREFEAARVVSPLTGEDTYFGYPYMDAIEMFCRARIGRS